MTAPLQRALEIAVVHHGDQQEKNGQPYAFHPIRLALQMKTDAERIVALLHDIVEDTNMTLDDLADEGFAPEVVEAVRLLTHTPSEDYDAYIARIATNPLARKVKLADLADNMDLSRIPSPTDRDRARMEKYKRAFATLRAAP